MADTPKSPTKQYSSATRDEVNRRGISMSENATTPITPPARYVPSNFSTPGSSYGKEEDAVIIELSSRHLKAGIEGESHPQCRHDFRPQGAKRLGDYRQWLPSYSRPKESLDKWGDGYELWRNNLRDFDLGLLGDKLERALRDVYNKNLLVDAGNARLVLVVPSLLPHPTLSAILQTLFERWAFPSVTLLPTPATALVSAGLRSALVVDVGWEETVVTAVYEYREVRSQRSTRAMRMVTRNFATWVKEILSEEHRLDLEMVETFLRRVGHHFLKTPESETQDDIALEWPTETFTSTVSLNKQQIRANLSDTLLGKETEAHPDDEETPVHRLIYNTLLLLPTDIRGICISRILFIGEGSESMSLGPFILKAFSDLVRGRGWTEVQSKKVLKRRQALSELAQTRAQPADARHDDIIFSDKNIPEERYMREKSKHVQHDVHGVIRQVDTLGSWTGASLLTTLRIKSFVEIQRDRFLSQGLTGASRVLDMSVMPQQRTSTLGIRPKAGERTSWTLSGWG